MNSIFYTKLILLYDTVKLIKNQIEMSIKIKIKVY